MTKKRQPMIGDLVAFNSKSRGELPMLVFKPDPKTRFKTDFIESTSVFIVLGQLGEAERHALKAFATAWEHSEMELYSTQLLCFNNEGISIIDREELVIISSHGVRSRVLASECE